MGLTSCVRALGAVTQLPEGAAKERGGPVGAAGGMKTREFGGERETGFLHVACFSPKKKNVHTWKRGLGPLLCPPAPTQGMHGGGSHQGHPAQHPAASHRSLAAGVRGLEVDCVSRWELGEPWAEG